MESNALQSTGVGSRAAPLQPASPGKEVAPQQQAVEFNSVINLAVLYIAILAHTLIMAYTDPISFTVSARFINIIIASVQVFLLCGIVLAFFLLTSNTTLVRLGLYDRYFQQYKYVYVSLMAALGNLLAVRAFSLYYTFSDEPVPFTWEPNSIYLPLWVLYRASVLVFYCLTAYGATRATFQPDYGITNDGIFD